MRTSLAGSPVEWEFSQRALDGCSTAASVGRDVLQAEGPQHEARAGEWRIRVAEHPSMSGNRYRSKMPRPPSSVWKKTLASSRWS